MKEKIIRFLRIILFDAFKSRWAWRRVPTQWYFDYMNYLRRKRFKENPILPDCYNAKLEKRATNEKYKRTLIISFPHMYHYNFLTYLENFDCLYFSPKEMNYFMRDVSALLNYTKKIILDNGYNRVVCLGLSKAGTIAIIYASALADKLKFIQFYSLSFSGIYKFYPWSLDRHPHYLKLQEIAKSDERVLKNIIKYGDTKKFLSKKRENVFHYNISGEYELRDMFNAYVLQGYCKYLKAFFIECDFHVAVINFTFNKKIANDQKKIKNLMALTLNNNDIAQNLSFLSVDHLTNTYMNVRKKDDKYLLSLNELIDELITTGKITSLYK
ncbi:hypothetical protein [Campylobacter devanensis]|uniref:hypothetical protein n=1 Tax=Campylobacter devanensis TaxID=3161138 RepID=UPI000A35A6D8|nr:hypothetical protein [Campylobacter sp. P0227]